MSEQPVTEVEFWRMRLVMAHVTGRGLHSAIYDTDPETWNEIQNKTAGLLTRYLKPGMSVLDAGCAYGASYSLIPQGSDYTGIDISPHLIEIAQLRHPKGKFLVGDITSMSQFKPQQFDLVLCRSVKHMLMDNGKTDLWNQIQTELLRVSPRILSLDYGNGDLPWELIERPKAFRNPLDHRKGT